MSPTGLSYFSFTFIFSTSGLIPIPVHKTGTETAQLYSAGLRAV
jgi:hypothetical protein